MITRTDENRLMKLHIEDSYRNGCFQFGRIIFLLLTLSSVTACVTTQTGGFNTDASEAQALQDYVQLAIAYYDNDDMQGARRHINNALEINDRDSSIYNVLALIYQREGDVDLADETFRRAIALDRANSRARNNYAAFLFTQQRFADAYDQLKVVTEDTTYEGRAIAFENLGRSAMRIDRESDAAQAYVRALQLNSNLHLSALDLAQIRFNQRDFLAARTAYTQYLTSKEFYNIPHTPRSVWLGIQIETEFGNDEIVAGYVRILSTLFRDSPEYLLYRNLVNDN